MEIISVNQLQKYDETLDKINNEFHQTEQLKKRIQDVDNEISALKLSLYPNRQKISHLNVKIFNNLEDILQLFESDVVQHFNVGSLNKSRDCNFFLIEIIFPRSLITKLYNWHLHISVSSDLFCTNRVTSLSNKTTILEVIPVSCLVFECRIEACLLYCLNDIWNVIELSSVDVDISYYFNSCKTKDELNSVPVNSLQITKLYNENKFLNCTMSNLLIQNQFKCNLSEDSFVPLFIRHTYHQLSLESFSEFLNDKSVLNFCFYIGGNKVAVSCNKDTRIIKIKCDFRDMLLMKKFFLTFSSNTFNNFHNKLKITRKKINFLEELELQELLVLHQEMRKLWI